MAQNAPIVVNDGANTPVAHTFNPSRIDADTAFFEDRSVGSLDLQPQLSLRVTRKSASSPIRRVEVKLELPLGVDPVTGVPMVSVYELKARIHKNSTALQRADGYAFLKNLAAHATVEKAFKDLESVW